MGSSIWCYTTETNTVKEECIPIDFCENTLSLNGVTSKIIEFGDPLIVLSALNDIIINSQLEKCPIKSCRLMISDCSIAYSQTDLTISTIGNLDVSL